MEERQKMTRDEAEALAAKREQHKPKSMGENRWAVIHNSAKGWHAALVDNQGVVARKALHDARAAIRRGDMQAFLDAAADSLLASCREEIENTKS